MNTGCLTRLFQAQPVRARRIALGVATLPWMMVCGVLAQVPTQFSSQITIPEGYAARHSVDMGGRMVTKVGSNAMYHTMVNDASGPRVQGETLDLHALESNKHALVDHLHAYGSGFGGDAINFAKLTAEKAHVYEFTGTFRRNRQYFDYDLLGNPNLPAGLSVPIGPSATSTTSLAWPQVQHSPFMFNTVRRMTDTDLVLQPEAKFSYHFAYSQNIMQGPSLSPARSGGILKNNALLLEFQRNSTDEYTGGFDWKPVEATTISFEEKVYHYKGDSYFTLDPNSFLVQEADGTPAYLGNWDASSSVYATSNCNTTSMINSTTILYAAQGGGKPIIDPACAVVTSYIRRQPTRVTQSSETLRFQSASIKNVVMNGQVNYSWATMNMPNYYESGWGLSGAVRNATYTGSAKGRREVYSADYAVTWQATKTFSLSDQASLVSAQQPGSSYLPVSTTLSTPSTAGSATVNYTGTLTSGAGSAISGTTGATMYNYFGNEQLTNTITANWDALPKLSLSLGYRYSNRNIGQGVPHDVHIPTTLANPVNGTVAVSENAGIFTAAYRPATNWTVNGSVEVAYTDNAFTTMTPRQLQHYRLHTSFKPKSWASFAAAYNDLERHNNTNNNAAYAAANVYDGPLNHVDYTRSASLTGTLTPNEHYSFNFDYAYTDVYTATNICFASGAATGLAGTATLTASGAPNLCASGVTWKARSFTDAPTQSATVGVSVTPIDKLKANLGYQISSVNGSQFFPDARNVNGSLVSTYQSPYANVAYTMHPGLVWKAEYNFYGYGEGGASGAQYCTTTATVATISSSSIVPCSSLSVSTGRNSSSAGMTAPRNFHASNVSVGVHYEF